MTDPRYPIGKFSAPTPITHEMRQEWLDQIEQTPAHMRHAVTGLSEQQLETPYREGGWTVRQVVHHIADSHMNSYVRFRMALTEDEPTIKPYAEDLWAELLDAWTAPIEPSLMLLETMHARWIMLLRSLNDEDWARIFWHPALGQMTLEKNLALYAWHGRHHVAHVLLVKNSSSPLRPQ